MMRYWRKIQRCKGIIYTLLPERDEADKYFKKYRDLVPEAAFADGLQCKKEIDFVSLSRFDSFLLKLFLGSVLLMC